MNRDQGLQSGFMCHPCNGVLLGIGMYVALMLPMVQKAPLSTLLIWLLFGIGLIMYTVAGIVVWELNFFLVVLGWALGWGAGWLLRDFGMPNEAQFYSVFAATLLPALITDTISLYRLLTTREH